MSDGGKKERRRVEEKPFMTSTSTLAHFKGRAHRSLMMVASSSVGMSEKWSSRKRLRKARERA